MPKAMVKKRPSAKDANVSFSRATCYIQRPRWLTAFSRKWHRSESIRMKRWIVLIMVALLIIAQQDYWQWSNTSLLMGFLPYSLAWHMGVSVAAAAGWFVVTLVAWPTDESLLRKVPGEELREEEGAA